jgi:hypothetical protein
MSQPAATVLKEAASGASAINHALLPELLVLLVDLLICCALVQNEIRIICFYPDQYPDRDADRARQNRDPDRSRS